MSKILTLELNEQVFAAIQRQSENMGIPPERLVATLVEQNFTQIFKSLLTDTEREVKRAKFERHFGEIDLGFVTDIDNESIDCDLAKEYASTHEEG